MGGRQVTLFFEKIATKPESLLNLSVLIFSSRHKKQLASFLRTRRSGTKAGDQWPQADTKRWFKMVSFSAESIWAKLANPLWLLRTATARLCTFKTVWNQRRRPSKPIRPMYSDSKRSSLLLHSEPSWFAFKRVPRSVKLFGYEPSSLKLIRHEAIEHSAVFACTNISTSRIVVRRFAIGTGRRHQHDESGYRHKLQQQTSQQGWSVVTSGRWLSTLPSCHLAVLSFGRWT